MLIGRSMWLPLGTLLTFCIPTVGAATPRSHDLHQPGSKPGLRDKSEDRMSTELASMLA